MERRKKLLSVAGRLAILGLILASCAPAAAPAPTAKPAPATGGATAPAVSAPTVAPGTPVATPKPAEDKPRAGGVLNVSTTSDPPHFDLHQASSIQELAPLAAGYDMLIQYDPLDKEKIIADLAEKWEVSNNGLQYTFSLRKNAKWHDGKPFTSADAKFSLDRMIFPPKNLRAPRQPHFLAVDRFEAPDPYTVKVYMKYPSASFIPMIATGWMLMFPKHVIDEKGDMTKVVTGTGPFKMKKFTTGTSYEWTRNQDYFIPARPYLDGLVFYIVKDRATRFAAFRTGQLQIYGVGESMTLTQSKIVERDMPGAVSTTFMAYNSRDFDMNYTKAPFTDIRVRQAVSLGIDRQAAVAALDEGDGVVGSLMPPGKWNIAEEELLRMPGYRQPKDADREQAKKLLAEAGFANGFATTIMAKAREPEIAEFMQAQLATIGIKATIDIREAGDWTQRADKGLHDTTALRLSLKVDDPEDIARYFTTGAPQNYAHFASKEIDDMFVKQSQAMDPAERKKITLDLQRRVMELAPMVKLDWFNYKIAFSKSVRDYKPALLYSNNMYLDVWLAK